MAKGQISFFIIIGLVILIAAGFMFYYVGRSSDAEPEVRGMDSGTIQSFVDSCLTTTTDNGIRYNGLQGGYFNAPEDKIKNLGYDVPIYHHYVEGDLMPTIETIQDQLSLYIGDRLDRCLNDFTVFRNQGYVITAGDRSITSQIRASDVYVTMNYPLDVRLGDETAMISTYSATVEAPIKEVYTNVRRYITKQVDTPNEEPLSYLMQLSYEYNFVFENVFREDTYVYAIVKDFATPDKGKYVFAFAIEYDWSTLEVESI